MIKKYIIAYNDRIENSIQIMKKLKEYLTNKNSLTVSVCDIDNLTKEGDFVFVIGGDGTILKTARFYSKFDTPIFGINLGRLGFLSQTSEIELENSVNEVLAGNYVLENRMMLSADNYNALNDFVIKGDECSRTSRFVLEIDGQFVCEYLADGIIISTPTGSTAYSMSAGGPILTPELEVITIVPICPHTFSARPIVVSSTSEIKIKPFKNNKYNVSADGQVVFSQTKDLIIKKAPNKASLALLNKNDFYSVLRNKLQWGISPASVQ